MTSRPRLAAGATNKPDAYIAGLLYVKTRVLEARVNVSALKKELTAKHYDPIANETTFVPLYDDGRAGYIGLPRAWARRHVKWAWDTAEDRRVRPRHDPRKFPATVKPRDEQQAQFMGAFSDLFANDNDNGAADNVTLPDVQARAATGSGKTVSFTVGAANVGVFPILVVVHTNRLKEQWLGSVEEKKGLRFLFGEQWVADNVGIIQQDVCDYEGKLIVIAMAPSLCKRKYPAAMYQYFGVVGVDEVHKMAAPTFHQVMGMFPAYYHVGLTATPKDGSMAKCITAHIDEPSITSDQTVMQPKVFRVLHEANARIINYNTGEVQDDATTMLNPLVRIERRQRILAELMFFRGYKRGRQCLGLSDRTDQLIDIRNRLIALGVPADDIGMYVGAYKTGEYKLTGKVMFADNVTRHFRGLPPFKSKAEANKHVRATIKEVGLQVLADQHKIDHWWHKPATTDYEDIEKRCPIVLATYGIFDTGIDIKRLDWGIELTPRGDVAQAVGRILREMAGKVMPEWYSIFDKLWCNISVELMGQTHTRKYNYKTPSRLEKRRRVSYHKQNAILIRIDNIDEALEAAKQAAANPANDPRSDGQRDRPISGQAGVPRHQERSGKPKRKLRLVRRAA